MPAQMRSTADAESGTDRCPRCGGVFHCGVHDDAPCACTTAKLDDALRRTLSERYVGCLCLRCLQQLSAAQRASEPDR